MEDIWEPNYDYDDDNDGVLKRIAGNRNTDDESDSDIRNDNLMILLIYQKARTKTLKPMSEIFTLYDNSTPNFNSVS